MSLNRIVAFAPEPRENRPEESIVHRARTALMTDRSPPNVGDAIEVLASSQFPNRHRDLERVLSDVNAPSRLRMRAALALARSEREAARQILRSALDIDDAIVRNGVMRALGMVGGADELTAIERVVPSLKGRTRDLAEFARTLISHRLGRADTLPDSPLEGKLLEPGKNCGRRVHTRVARPGTVERALSSASSLYGIEVDEQAVVEYSCERSSGAILLNRDLRKAPELLRKRPALVGLEARRNRASGDYSVSYVILSRPVGGAIEVNVHLTNGTRVFTGRAEVRGDALSWTLRAIQRPGAFPFKASGILADGQLTVESAEAGPRVEQKLKPKPIDLTMPL